jgi:hypothetical protein
MSVLQQIMTLIQKHYYKMGDIPKAINQEYLGDEIETILATHKANVNKDNNYDETQLPYRLGRFIQSQLVPCGLCNHGHDNATDRLCDDLNEIEY